MAFSLTCPDCSSKLKTATAIPLGKDVQCPKCKTKFKVTNDNIEEITDSKAAPVKAKAAPAPSKAAPAAPKAAAQVTKAPAAPAKKARDEEEEDNPFGGMDEAPAKKGRAGDEEDEAPRSRKRTDDDDDDRPRKRGRDDDEDEKPKSRRRPDDDDEDEKPRKKGRGDDDEDETPKSRKRRDEDDGDEAPKSRKRGDDDEDEDKPRKKGRGDEEDDAPKSRKRGDDDEDDDKPRKKGRGDDDEDDAPKSRKRGDDDEDDDKPRKKGRGDDDDDYSPRSRRGRDEDEDDDRPRRRGRGRNAGGSNKKKLLIYGGIGVAAVAGIILLLMLLFGGGGSYDKEMAAFLPESTTVVAGADIEKLLEVDSIKGLVDMGMAAGGKEMEQIKKAGITAADISKVMLGMVEGDKGVAIIRFKKAYDKAKIATALNAKEVAGTKAYHKANNACLYFAKDDLLVLTENEDVMKKVVAKDDKVALNETLKEMLGKVSGGNIWVATSTNMFANAGGGKRGSPLSGLPVPMDADLTNAINGAKAFALMVDIDNKNFKVKGVVKCGDSGAASKADSALNKQLKEFKEMFKNMPSGALGGKAEMVDAAKDILNSVDVGSSGDLLELSVKGSYEPFKDMMKGGFPGGGMFR